MNVGQVEFSVSSDTLTKVLAQAKELQAVLEAIDKSNVGAKSASGAKDILDIHNKTRRMSANIEKQYAIQEKARQKKRDKEREKEWVDTEKRNYRHIIREGKKMVKAYKQELRDEEKARKKAEADETKARQDNYKATARMEFNRRKERKAQEKKDQAEAAKGQKELDSRWQKEFDANTKKQVEELKKRPTMYDAAQKLGETQAQVMIDRAKEMTQFRRDWQTAQVNWGAQMQTLGSAMQRASAPFTNIYKGLTMGIGYRLLYKMTDSLEGAFSRYDTMKTYGIVLKELGMDASKKFAVGTGEAMDAIHNLEQAVLGLPTGLDEIVASMRVYAGATGDVEKATKLAIAANNAFIAGGMDARQQMFTQRQLLSLAGGAELSSNQWDSLRRNAPLAIRAVAKAMGKDVQSMIDGLKSGSIAGKEFLDTFVKVGTEGQLKNAAQKMKQTWDSVSQNMQNAMNRAGEGILKTLDEVFEKTDGRNFLQHVLGVDKNGEYIGGGIRGAIDKMAESAQKWIKANPDAITHFFDNLSKIDFAGIAGGFAKFALTMGRVYAWLGKTFGSGGLVQTMLWMNVVGKVIQTFGGFVKGTAGIASWIAMFVKFKGLHKVATNAGKIYKSGGAIVGATRTFGTMALTWQQVASKGLTIAAIPAMAWAFKEVAKGLQELAKVDMSGLSVGKFGAIAGAIGELGALAAVLGTLTASNHFGWITTASMAIGTAEVAAISKTMKWIGEGLNAIAEAKLPEAGKISSVMKKMDEISRHFKSVNIFESIGKIFDTWTKSSEFKAVKNATDAFKGIADMVNLKLPKKWKTKSKDRFDKVIDFVTDIENMVVDLNERLMERAEKEKGKWAGSKKGTSKAEVQGNAYAYIKEQLREFADNMQSISDGLGYLDTALMSTKKFNKDYARLNKLKDGTILPFDWDAVYYRIKNFADQIYKFATRGEGEDMSPFEKMKKAAEQLKDANFEQISNLFTTLPKIIKGMETTYKKIGKSSLFEDGGLHFQEKGHVSPLTDFTNKLDPLFKAIGTLNTKIPENIDGLKRLKSIQTAIGRVPGIINQIVGVMNNTQVGQINVATIQGIVAKIKEALGAFDELKGKTVDLDIKINGTITDNATDKINDAYKSIKTASDKIEKLSGTKTVKIHVNAVITGVTAAVQAINDAIAKIRDAISRLGSAKAGAYSAGRAPDNPGGHPVHTGGKIQYRAHGGEIYKTRGTDSVPAMLTPGEWVINRRSSSLLGDNVLWKLNHMDIRGAINALSSRFGAPSSIVNNTYNRNIGGITLNNGNSASVGLERTSKWVKGL